MTFDVQGARKAGYKDSEIADYLAAQSGFDAAGARKVGYNDVEIVDHLIALQPARQQEPAKPKQSTLPTRSETDAEWMQRMRESDAAGVPIPARMTQQEADQWGDTIKDIPTQVRAGAASTVAGMLASEFAEQERMTGLRGPEEAGLSDAEVAAKRRGQTDEQLAIAREANQDLEDIGRKDRTLLQRSVGTAAQSLMQSGLPLAVGIATRNPAAAAATMMEPTSGQTFGDLANKYADQRADVAGKQGVLAEVYADYPGLAKYGFQFRDSSSGGDGRKLEFYPPGESHSPFPDKTKPGIERFDPSMGKQDLFGEMLHFLPTVDKTVGSLRKEFQGSISAEQQEHWLRGDYQSQVRGKLFGKNPPTFEQWLGKQGGDAFFRGYLTGQYPAEAYTPEQKELFARLDTHLRSGGPGSDARTADLKRAQLHGDVQGILEVGTEALPFGRLLKPGSGPVRRLVEFLVAELPGESIATVTQAVDQAIAESPPGATAAEVVSGIKEGVRQLPETWVSTILAGGAQAGAVSLAERATTRKTAVPPVDESAPTDEELDATAERFRLDTPEAQRALPAPRNQADFEVNPAGYAAPRGEEQPLLTQGEEGTTGTLRVDGDGTARPETHVQQSETDQAVDQWRDSGLDEVANVNRRGAAQAAEASARPSTTQNVELFEETAPDGASRQLEVRPLTEAEFQQFIRPVLRDESIGTLEDYQARFPHATHVRLDRQNNGYPLDYVGDAGSARPSGPNVKRVSGEASERFVQSVSSEQPPKRDANSVDPSTDSLLTAVSKLGGLSREEAIDRGLEPTDLSHRGHGINLTFRRSGKKFNEMAEALRDLGYPVTDPNSLQASIDRELGRGAVADTPPAASQQEQSHEPEAVQQPSSASEEAPEGELPARVSGQAAAPQPEAAATTDAGVNPRPGKVGDQLSAGEVVTTASGRPTTPFPKIDLGSDRKAGNTIKRVDQWLMDNALAEAEARGDSFNAQQFRASRDRPSQADKDSAEEYLFGDTQPPVIPSILKPLSSGSSQQQIDAAAHAAATSPTNDLPQPSAAQKEAENYKVGDPIKLHGYTIRVENPKGTLRTNLSVDKLRALHKAAMDKRAKESLRQAVERAEAGEFDHAIKLTRQAADQLYPKYAALSDAANDAVASVWANRMPAHYGRILRTMAPDGDHIDVFLGPKSADESLPVFVYDTNKPGTDTLDEYKVMLGYGSEREAREAFDSAYDKGFAERITRSVSEMPPDVFREWLDSGEHKGAAAEWLERRNRKTKPGKTEESAAAQPAEKADLAEPTEAEIDDALRSLVGLTEGGEDAARKSVNLLQKDTDLADAVASRSWGSVGGRGIPGGHIEGRNSKVTVQIRGVKRNLTPAEVGARLRRLFGETDFDAGPSPEGSKRLADWVAGRLKERTAVSWDQLFKQANLLFGGTQAEGKYTPKDAYDAIELGVNLYLHEIGLKPDGTVEQARAHVDDLAKMLSLIPTQTKRTEEQDEFQQFSTPPTYAYVANWVAAPRAGETYLEPSAGIGGLAVFGRNAGARVVANELSPRRTQLLKLLGFDQVLAENAEQLNNVLPDDIKPTLVVMNPPFSASAGRIKGERNTMIGARHIEQALQRLAPNGRLVGIVGEGMADDRPAFRDWWKKIKGQYNVRANVGIDGKGYAKYGTTFDNQMLVIDKTGPTTAAVVTGKFGSVAEVIPQLEGIRNDRPSNASKDRQDVQRSPAERSGEPTAARKLEGSDRPAGRVSDAVGDQGSGNRSASEPVRTGQRDAGKRRGADERSKPAKGDESADAGGRRNDARSQRAEPGEGAGRGRAAAARDATPESGGDSGVTVEAQADQRHEGELTDSVFEQYRPQRLSIPGAQPHPGRLVQSAAMASVSPPSPTYSPKLPKDVISKGMLSLAQLEAVVYAGQAHSQTLSTGERKGYFIGDGTGVGKGREISGIILDNQRQGRKKSIWVSEKRGLQKDAQRDFEGVGGDKDQIFWQGNTKAAQKIQTGDGILFSTYATLRSEEKRAANDADSTKPKTRLQQIVDWAGEDFDGVLVFDEAHNAGNAIAMKGKRGVKKASDQALAVIELQKALPKARVVYVSATGATEVSNLSYATRLGLWGPGTPFASVESFINEVSRGGLAAMELVARDMKQMGIYVARSLSFDDVSYARLEHQLTDIQTDIYNELAGAWQTVLQNVHEALKLTGVVRDNGRSLNGLAKGKALSAFWGAHQRFFNQIMTAMQMPSVLDQMHKDLADGHAIVLQLVNTNEATQERKLAQRADEDDLDDLDLTPRENLVQYIRNSFPVLQYEEYRDEGGNRRSRPVTDSQGNLVMSKEAIELRDKIIRNVEAIRVPDGPLEIILNEFGTKNVAEVTGRRRRVVRDENGKSVIETRGRTATQGDADSFQADKKRVLIFSDAGGTGFSFQADLTKKNQRRRMHYLLQPGWRADKAVQGFGRTHRTNQKSAPHYRLVTTDLPAQKRFISSIARRLDQLGALTKGQRDTANQGLFSAKDNLESEYAEDAISRLVEDIYQRKVPDLPFQQFVKEMGFDSLADEVTGALNVAKIPPVPQFLNRLLSLSTTMQGKVFGEFSSRMEDLIDKAIADGTLDVGMETLPALEVKVKREDTVYSDPSTGAETKYVELDLTQRTEKKPFPTLAATAYLRNKKSGKVWVQRAVGTSTLRSGAVVDNFRLTGTLSSRYINANELKNESQKFERISQDEAEQLWAAENEQMPDTYTEPAHLITGAILPIWDRLPGQIRVVRTQSSDGRRYLGRYINKGDVADVLKRLDVQSSAARMTPAQVSSAILNGAEGQLANGWKLLKVRVSNENRIEIKPNTFVSGALRDELKSYGLFFERIEWQDRLFVPVGPAGEVAMGKLLKSKPLAEITEPENGGDDDGGGVALSIRDPEQWKDGVELRRQQQVFQQKHSLGSLQSHIDAIAKRWGTEGLRVKVVDNEYALKPRLVNVIGSRDAFGKTIGLMDSREGVAYLLRENAVSLAEMERVLFHEVEGHLSIRQFFGDEIVPFLNHVAMVDYKGVKKIGTRYGFYDERGRPKDGNEAKALVQSADEYVAELAESYNSAGPKVRRLWDWLVSHFAELARKAGWKTLKPSASEIRGWVVRAQRSLRGKPADAKRASQASDSMRKASSADDAPLAAREDDRSAAFNRWFKDSKIIDDEGRPLVVYHGTTSSFESFSREVIGDNTGAGDWGDGFYFTDSPAAASTYANGDGGNVMPVYLSIQNPATNEVMLSSEIQQVIDYQMGFTSVEEALAKRGYDGIIYTHKDGAREFVVFRPEQIKSATGNSGSFDPASEDIALKIRDGSSAWDAPESSKLDNLIYTLQDKHVDMKRVQEAITQAKGDLSDDVDAYLREELFHGRVAYRLERFLNEELKPFLQRVNLSGLSLDELEQYLHARHAPERNAAIAKINPKMQDGGSGMTDAEAAAYMAKLSRTQRTNLEQLARAVDAMTAGTRQTLVGYGLESQGTIDAWSTAYKHYVPLYREDMDTPPGAGQGFSVRGPSTKRAMGSDRAVVNIIANIAMQRERALVRGEKNRVANALLGLAIENPNEDFWKVDQPERIRYIDPRTGLVAERIDPTYKSRDNVVTARMPDDEGNIVEHTITFNLHDTRAERMARAFKSIDVNDLNEILAMSAKITRYFASINTQYNPVFGVINLIRDTQAAMLGLTSTHLDGAQRAILQDTISALRGIYIDARTVRAGGHPTSSWAQLWEEFQRVGGQTGYRDMFRTSNDRAEAIRAELSAIGRGEVSFARFMADPLTTSKDAGINSFYAVKNWLTDINLTMENAVRLATYKAGKENQHLSNERAASIAKNITVNFNRKGEVTNQAGALYAFFNASAQGTARVLEVLMGPRGKQIIAGGILLGMAQSLMLAAAGFDDDEPPEWVRERNLVIPLPGTDKKYLTVPYPLGFHILPNIGRVSADHVRGGFKGTGKRVTELLSLLVEAFSPLGGGGGTLSQSLSQMVTPTAADPLTQLGMNVDWTGKPIAREDFNSLKPTPGHTRAKASASDFGLVTARIINTLTGGTEYVPGAWSPTPDQIDYLIGQATGGVGREFRKAWETAEFLTSGELPPTYKVPLLGRLYGNAQDRASYGNRFYDLVRRSNLHQAEIEGRARHGEDYQQYLNDNPEARVAVGVTKSASQISRLRRFRRQAESQGDKDKVKAIDSAIESRMREAVEMAKAAQSQ